MLWIAARLPLPAGPMSKTAFIGIVAIVAAAGICRAAAEDANISSTRPPITVIDPPEYGFFAKQMDFHGIPIKAPAVVVVVAMYAAYDRIAMETKNLPMVVSNLVSAGAELHIIGRNQVTTDLPEWRHDKHVPLDEYNGLTRDQRTRGMGGFFTSCGEENLLNLPTDHYRGRDICLHEFAHEIRDVGLPDDVVARFDKQYSRSLTNGLWVNSYAGSNPDEYFAELTMWYFGTHGDLTMTGPKPENGPEGLKKYDPEAYALFDDFYSGRIPIGRREPQYHRRADGRNPDNDWPPTDSLDARAMVDHLASYQTNVTKVEKFYTDAGMKSPTDHGTNGWYVTLASNDAATNAPAAGPAGTWHYRIAFRRAALPVPMNTGSATNAPPQGGPRSRPSQSRGAVAELEFTDGVLTGFKWDN